MCIRASRSSAASIGRTLAIHATPTAFAAALDQIAAPNDIRWRDETKTAHADYLAFSEKPTAVPGPVNIGEIVVGLRDVLPADAMVLHRRRQFLDLGAALLPLSQVRHAVRAGLRLHGLRPAVGGRDETGCIRSARWSRSAATAIS